MFQARGRKSVTKNRSAKSGVLHAFGAVLPISIRIMNASTVRTINEQSKLLGIRLFSHHHQS